MGCGQSKIGIYQRKSKNKKNGSKRCGDDGKNDEETEEAEETLTLGIKDCREGEKSEDDSDAVTSKIKQMAQQQQQTGGAVLAQSDISSSQLDFFKMLDEKIENGPDYEESDEEEHRSRMAGLLQEWRAACLARQQKKNEEAWSSPSRLGKPYQEDVENYGRRMNPVDTQRFPTGYSPCPPNSTTIHLQNSLRMTPDPHRIQPKIPVMSNYHAYQAPMGDPYNHEDAMGHPLSTSEPPNPLRPNYSHLVLRQSSINSQLHYPENPRLYSDNVRPFSDFPRTYQEQRAYQMPRAVPTVNVLHEYRMYKQDGRGYQMYQEDGRQQQLQQQPVEVQRMMPEIPKQDIRPPFGSVDNQRLYHERLKEKQRQYADAGQTEGPRPQTSFQRPPMLAQRSMQESSKMYRELESEEHCFGRPERFPDTPQDCSAGRIHNPPAHYKMGRSVSVDVQYVAEPPPPREMIPLQGAPGPPQGSPRPLVARGLQTNIHRLPANSDVHYRKPQRAFT